MNENNSPLQKRKSYKLSEKASALMKMEDENLSYSEMEKLSNISGKSLADWVKKALRLCKLRLDLVHGCQEEVGSHRFRNWSSI